jgi:hypothetical protein
LFSVERAAIGDEEFSTSPVIGETVTGPFPAAAHRALHDFPISDDGRLYNSIIQGRGLDAALLARLL